jgi:hypothetical protein
MSNDRLSIGNSVWLHLPNPKCLSKPRQVRQLLELTYKNEKKVIEAILKIENQRIQLIGLSPLGVEIFSLDYDGFVLKSQLLIPLSESFNPAFILADLSLAYADKGCLTKHLSGPFEINDSFGHREIYEASKKLIEINYQKEDRLGGGLEFKNLLRAYSYKITFLEELSL